MTTARDRVFHIAICPVCGRNDRWTKLGGSFHWTNGGKCPGTPERIAFVPEADLAALRARLGKLDRWSSDGVADRPHECWWLREDEVRALLSDTAGEAS